MCLIHQCRHHIAVLANPDKPGTLPALAPEVRPSTMDHPRLTHQYHITLHHLHRSLISTDLTQQLVRWQSVGFLSLSQQQSAFVANLAKTAGATSRRRENKKKDKANDTDIVQEVATNLHGCSCTATRPLWNSQRISSSCALSFVLCQKSHFSVRPHAPCTQSSTLPARRSGEPSFLLQLYWS